MSESSSFFLLDSRIQHFIWAEGWEELRGVQEQAIPAIVKGNSDVIIAASTAAGKTEAAFFPALSYLLVQDDQRLIVYVSPLKALINDQFGRLERLCEDLEIPVWPWHGDISASSKARFLKKPNGVLLITPESLEAILCNRGTAVAAVFARTAFFIVDELHAFIGSERGKQLQSLMHRIDVVLQRFVPRIGLSATLGDMQLGADFLRPSQGSSVRIVEAESTGAVLRVGIKGYEEPFPDPEGDKDAEQIAPPQIASHLFATLSGSNNLVFPNSRREVERYTYLLNRLAQQNGIPNEFWPHHGSLSKEIRAETEAALKQKSVPATAICTSTLELGIDIGAVKSVAQIESPPSVASLRQRLGRSGRRKNEPAILRGYVVESGPGDSALAALLRLHTVELTAMVTLLMEKWFEPPRASGLHLSTLVQQLLSLIAQNGGIRAADAYRTLCQHGGPFAAVSKEDFVVLLRHLGQKDILMQESSGLLLHGTLGEKLVNHYSFYAAFASDEEFRVIAGGKQLGSLPVSQLLLKGQRILFAGKTWLVNEVDEEQKVIYVSRATGGTPPMFNGGGGHIHTRVRQRMRELLSGTEPVSFLDMAAQKFLTEGRRAYASFELSARSALDSGSSVHLLTWLGDAGNQGLASILRWRGVDAAVSQLGVEVQKGGMSGADIGDVIADAASCEVPDAEALLVGAHNLLTEKWDWALPDNLLRRAYASLNLDLKEAGDWLRGYSTTVLKDIRG